MPVKFTIAIIGCGLTGTSLFCQLVDRFSRNPIPDQLNPEAIRVFIFELGSQMGPGIPHNADFVKPYHITNMCAEHMSIFHGRPGDFQTWVAQNRANLENRFPDLFAELIGQPGGTSQSCNHYPRAIMGAYLADQFKRHVDLGREMGMQIESHTKTETVDLIEKPNHVSIRALELTTGNVRDYPVDRAVISTGHWFNKTHGEGYFPSPWPADRLLQNIPLGSRVAIIGTSLSAVEAALTLTADGHFIRQNDQRIVYRQSTYPRKLTLLSRNGLLPTVRGCIGSYRNQILTPHRIRRLLDQKAGQLRLGMLFDLLDAELRQAYGIPFDWQAQLDTTAPPAKRLARSIATAMTGDGPEGDVIWQTVLNQVLPFVRDLYLGLSIAERKRFEKQFKTLFFIFAAPQPIVNAQKLLALINAGDVQIYRLNKKLILDQQQTTPPYVFSLKDSSGHVHEASYDYVVDARGQKISWRDNPSNLAKNLQKKRVVHSMEVRLEHHASKYGNNKVKPNETYDVGSVWIDPQTHAVMQVGSSGLPKPSDRIFAVGAMTRGQIIDTSMAQSLAASASRIVDGLFKTTGNL